MPGFETFTKRFKGDVVTPCHPDYEQALDRWAANARRRAAVVAFVKDAEDVALAITYARDAGLGIAIRGGGHSSSGASSSEGGLVVDLSKYLNNVKVDSEKKLAYVQGGAQWKGVDHATIKHGLAGVAGTVNHTGVGGLTVGGGYGWLSGLYGLVVDNTVQATVVTAEGCILTANEDENPDLFWAIRGGGSNFGVVTEFVFKLHPQRRKVFAGPLYFSPDQCEEVAAFLDEWWPRAKPNEGILFGMLPNHSDKPTVMAFVFHNGSEEEGRQSFQELIAIGPMADCASEVPYEELNNMTNPLSAWGLNYYFKGALLSEKPSQDINSRIYDQVLEISSSPDHVVAVLLEYFPQTKINSVPPGATPFRRDLPGNTMILVQWKETTPSMCRRAKQIAHEIAQLLPKGEPYANYSQDCDVLPIASAARVERTKALFGENYSRLRAIKKKYDPKMVFNKWHAIVPA